MTEGIDNNTQEFTAAGAKGATVVTGASTGIGEATVRALRRKAGPCSPSPAVPTGSALAAETGAVALPADVTDDADVARLLDEVTRAGGIDTLINIAGGARGADKVAGAKTEDWEWMFQVNVLGSMKLIRAFLPMCVPAARAPC